MEAHTLPERVLREAKFVVAPLLRSLFFGETINAQRKTTPEGFEPSRAEPTGLAGRRLNHSAKVSARVPELLICRCVTLYAAGYNAPTRARTADLRFIRPTL